MRGAHGGAGGRASTSRAGSSTEGEEVGGGAASEADEHVAVEGAKVVGRRHEVVQVGIHVGEGGVVSLKEGRPGEDLTEDIVRLVARRRPPWGRLMRRWERRGRSAGEAEEDEGVAPAVGGAGGGGRAARKAEAAATWALWEAAAAAMAEAAGCKGGGGCGGRRSDWPPARRPRAWCGTRQSRPRSRR